VDVHALLRADFGLDVVALEPVRGGSDETAQVWRARTADGRSYAVKSGRSRVLDLDVRGVPRPLPGRSLHVTPWIEGDSGAPRLVHWRALGRLLREVHGQTADVPRMAYDHSRRVAVVRNVKARMTPELAQVWPARGRRRSCSGPTRSRRHSRTGRARTCCATRTRTWATSDAGARAGASRGGARPGAAHPAVAAVAAGDGRRRPALIGSTTGPPAGRRPSSHR
jgi:hypothetical protein